MNGKKAKRLRREKRLFEGNEHVKKIDLIKFLIKNKIAKIIKNVINAV
jgi:hypothetical protein